MTEFDKKSDEELIALYRLGEEAAYRVLFYRFWEKRSRLIYHASPALTLMFNSTDKDHIFLSAFLKATNAYRSGKKTFQSFFLLNLKQDLSREAKKTFFPYGGRYPLSLDIEDGETGLCLHDSIPSDSSSDSFDLLLNKTLLLSMVGDTPSLPKNTKALVAKVLDGFTLKEAADSMEISYRTAKSIYAKFKAWLRTLLDKEF